MKLLNTSSIILFIICCQPLLSQPQPGDVFKEYTWHNQSGDCKGALRVGGKLDYRLTLKVDDYKDHGRINPPFDLDLNAATKAELVIEKMLCHGGTEGLRVAVNGYHPIQIPEPEHIPHPQSAYAHHLNLIVPVDLNQLREGKENGFVFEVDTAGHWWPQNLVYGLVLRIYYDPQIISAEGKISTPVSGDQLGLENQVLAEFPVPEEVEKVDLVGYYEDADLEGDGLYRQWHYAYHKGQIYNHIGTITGKPFEFVWDTEWLPDQKDKILLAAFVHRRDGYIYMTETVANLELIRPGYSVELCKPYMRPKGWFTRNGEFSQRFWINGDLKKPVEAKMVFRTWSPGYFNGIYINDFVVFIKEGPTYAYYEHHIPVQDVHVFESGENILTTGKTPLFHNSMVHGVEIQWPGIIVLLKYDLNNPEQRTH